MASAVEDFNTAIGTMVQTRTTTTMESLIQAAHSLSLCTVNKPVTSDKLNQTQCPLFTLPGEIRNTVYELVLSEDEAVVIPTSGKRHAPSLLVSCKQVRHEARKVYYTINSFTIRMNWYSMEGPEVWAKAAPKFSLQHVKRLTITFNTYDHRNPDMKEMRGNFGKRYHRFAGLKITLPRQYYDEEDLRILITQQACHDFGLKCAAILSSLISDGLASPHVVFNTIRKRARERACAIASG